MRDMMKNVGSAVLMVALLGGTTAVANELEWNNAVGDNDFANTNNFEIRVTTAYNFLNVSLTGADRAIMSAGTNSVDDIRVGIYGNGELDFAGGYLKCNRGSGDTRIGLNGNDGTVNMSGGIWDVGQDLAVGLSSGSTAIFNLSGGVLNNTNGKFTVGGNGVTGLFSVTGGDFVTRNEAQIYVGGTFEVIGATSTNIGIGSYVSNDGAWIQDPGSTLKVRVAADGVTPIMVAGSGGTHNGAVTFKEGAVLDVGFVDGFSEIGTWPIMEFEGDFLNLGLQFAEGIDTNMWGVGVTNNTLVISYGEDAPDLPGKTTPIAPQGVYALPDVSNMVTIRWDVNELASLGYKVYRSLDDVTFVEIAADVLETSYVDADVTNGETYYYKVSGVNEHGEGDLSDSDPALPTPYLILGTDGTYQNKKNLTKHQLFDGDVDTYFDASETGTSWAGLDFGENNEQRIYEIQFVIRGGWGSAYERSEGAYFEGANTEDFSDAVILHTVSTNAANYPAENAVTVMNETPFRYVRLHAPAAWPLYSMAEVSFTLASDFTEQGTSIPWLEGHGLSEADEFGDGDVDGLLTWEEYVAGTNPTNAASVLQMNSITSDGTDYVVSWQSVEGKSYKVTSFTSLINPTIDTETPVTGKAIETSYTSTVSSASSVFFEITVE